MLALAGIGVVLLLMLLRPSSAPASMTTVAGATAPTTAGAAPTPGNAIVVTRADDPPGPGRCATSAGDCSMRQAIVSAGAEHGDIVFVSSVDNTPIMLTRGELHVSGKTPLTITGDGTRQTVIDGDGSVTHQRVIEIDAGATVTLRDLTVRNGHDTTGSGGGILNNGNLMLADTVVSGNTTSGTATARGGGIDSAGALRLERTNVSGNTATVAHATSSGPAGTVGGGIAARGALSIVESTISDNTSTFEFAGSVAQSLREPPHGCNGCPVLTSGGGPGSGNAGGIDLEQTTVRATIARSTIVGNSALGHFSAIAGGIGTYKAVLTVSDSTISDNRSDTSSSNGYTGPGGLLASASTVTLLFDTMGGNQATIAGATNVAQSQRSADQLATECIGVDSGCGPEAVLLQSSLIDGANPGQNCRLNPTPSSYSLDNGDTCLQGGGPGDKSNIDPKLAALAVAPGARNPTQALLTGSPAIGAGSPSCPPPETDENGVTRAAGHCDAGAVQYGAAQPPPSSSPPASPSASPSRGSAVTAGTAGSNGSPWLIVLLVLLIVLLLAAACDYGLSRWRAVQA